MNSLSAAESEGANSNGYYTQEVIEALQEEGLSDDNKNSCANTSV